jgi:hypothetical protein
MKTRVIYRSLLIAALASTALLAGTSGADTAGNSAMKKLPPVAGKAISGPATTPGNPAGPAASNSIQTVALAQCAMGFNKTNEVKHIPNGALLRFECTTPVITCPKNPSFTSVSLEVKIISTNPEQTAKQIRYECKYFSPEQ